MKPRPRGKLGLVPVLLLALATVAGAQSFDKLNLKGTTVTYWYQHSRARETALQAMITRFNTTNAWGITVKGEYAGGYSDIANKMIAGIAGGSTPDLVVAYQNNAATYQLSGALVDLTPYVNDPKFGVSAAERQDYFEGFLAQDLYPQFGGARLGWPPNRSVEVVYYNADWLKAIGASGPPKTWDEFYADCKAATDAAKGTYGYAVSLDASSVFAQVIARGGDITLPKGGYTFTSKPMTDSMSFMQKLFKDGYARKIGEQYGDQTDFANGKVLFNMSSTSGMPFYDDAVLKGAKGAFKWGVAALPHTTPQPVQNVYGASVSVVKSTPEKQLASWLFLRWMSEPAQQAEWVRVSNYFPVRKSTADALGDYLAKNPHFAEAFAQLSSGTQKSEPSFTGYDLVRDAVSAAFNQILDGAPVGPTLAALDVKANKLYRQNR